MRIIHRYVGLKCFFSFTKMFVIIVNDNRTIEAYSIGVARQKKTNMK